MNTLSQRLNKLLYTVTNEAIKNECLKAVELLTYNVNENIIRPQLLESLSKIKNLDLETKKFIKNERKQLVISDMGLNEAFSEFYGDDSIFKANPQLAYLINPIRESYNTNQVPSTYLAEKLVNVLSNYSYIPVIDKHITKIKNLFESNRIDVLLSNAIYYIKNSSTNQFYKDLSEKMTNCLYEEIDTTELLYELNKYKYEPFVLTIINELQKVTTTPEQLITLKENKEFQSHKIYSFIYFEPDNMNEHYFYNNGKYFRRTPFGLDTLNEDEINLLPIGFKAMSQYINGSNVHVSETGITINLTATDKVLFETSGNYKNVYLNNQLLDTPFMYEQLLSNNILAHKFAPHFKIMRGIYENLNTLVEIDFGKNIKSKHHMGLGVSIYKVNEDFYVHLQNPAMGVNRIVENINVMQAKNIIFEHMKYDITESLYEYMSTYEAKIQKLRVKQREINESIIVYNKELDKIAYAKKVDPSLLENDQLQELENVLEDELNQLKQAYNELDSEIEDIQNVHQDELSIADLRSGMEVQIKGKNIKGKISSIDGISHQVVVTTDDNQTMSVSINDLSLVGNEVEHEIEDDDEDVELEEPIDDTEEEVEEDDNMDDIEDVESEDELPDDDDEDLDVDTDLDYTDDDDLDDNDEEMEEDVNMDSIEDDEECTCKKKGELVTDAEKDDEDLEDTEELEPDPDEEYEEDLDDEEEIEEMGRPSASNTRMLDAAVERFKQEPTSENWKAVEDAMALVSKKFAPEQSELDREEDEYDTNY